MTMNKESPKNQRHPTIQLQFANSAYILSRAAPKSSTVSHFFK